MTAVAPPAATGPVGQRRGTAFVVLIGLITFGIYWIYWAFKTQDEMKRHTGDGLGGVAGVAIWILLPVVTAFSIPSEVGNMVSGSGREKPITGWTGLWLFPFGVLIIPIFVWFVRVQGALNDYWASVERPPAREPTPPSA